MDKDKIEKILNEIGREDVPEDVRNTARRQCSEFMDDIRSEINNGPQKKMVNIIKVAAIVAVISGIGIFVFKYHTLDRFNEQDMAEIKKTPAELMTARTLYTAYRQGGIEAVERRCEMARKTLKPRTTELTIKELLTELVYDKTKGNNHANFNQ